MSGHGRAFRAELGAAVAVLVLALALIVLAGGCGGAPAGTILVKMQGLEFQPAQITIKKGTTVRWINEDQDVHTSTATSYKPDTNDPASWTSPILNPGESYDRTFDTAGSFDYTDSIHAYMTGNVTVTE